MYISLTTLILLLLAFFLIRQLGVTVGRVMPILILVLLVVALANPPLFKAMMGELLYAINYLAWQLGITPGYRLR